MNSNGMIPGVDFELTNEQKDFIDRLLKTYSRQSWSIGRYKYSRLETIIKQNYYESKDKEMLNQLRKNYISLKSYIPK